MDRGTWWATVHGVAKSWTQLSTHIEILDSQFMVQLKTPRINSTSQVYYSHRIYWQGERRQIWLKSYMLISFHLYSISISIVRSKKWKLASWVSLMVFCPVSLGRTPGQSGVPYPYPYLYLCPYPYVLRLHFKSRAAETSSLSSFLFLNSQHEKESLTACSFHSLLSHFLHSLKWIQSIFSLSTQFLELLCHKIISIVLFS